MSLDEAASRQRIVDEEHLRLLRTFYLISAGTTAFFSLIGLVYGLMGAFIGSVFPQAPVPSAQTPPEVIAWMFTVFGFGFMAAMLALTGLKVGAAWCLGRRRARLFCMIVAGLCCPGVPYGTILGVFTFIVLSRPTVAELFKKMPDERVDSRPPANASPS